MTRRGRRPVPKTQVSRRQRDILEAIRRTKKAAQRLVERASIVLMSSEAMADREQGERLGVNRQRVERWRRRWNEAEERLAQAEQADASDADLKAMIVDILADRPRSGAPTKFAAEQITDIVALACESPKDSGLPISHWTPSDLAREAVNRKIVESISPRHLDRFLKGGQRSASQKPVLA